MPNRRAKGSKRPIAPLKPISPAELMRWDTHRRILRDLFCREDGTAVAKGTPVFVLSDEGDWHRHILKHDFVYVNKAFQPKYEDLISLKDAEDLRKAMVTLFKTHNTFYPVIAIMQSPQFAFPILYNDKDV